VTPRGFAALVLNLRVVVADPTVDGSEFELKRALVAMSNLVLERMSALPGEMRIGETLDGFLDEVEGLEIWGQPVVTAQLVAATMDVLGLIDAQRESVRVLLAGVEGRIQQLAARSEMLRDIDLGRLADSLAPGSGRVLEEQPEAAAVVRRLATSELPGLELEAARVRYRSYLAYLDDLAEGYGRELRVVSLARLRRRRRA
jgi:hypothetical protein